MALDIIKGRNKPNLNELFEEFDPYEGRIYHLWELMEIFDFKVKKESLERICEANQEETAIRNRCVFYTYLFNTITNGDKTPNRFKGNQRKHQPASVYASITHKLTPSMDLVNDMLANPIFASGKVDEAFDTLFKAPASATAPTEVNLDKLRTMVSQNFSTKQYSDECLNAFIDFVSYMPHIYCFSKVKFVAAMRFLITMYKPHIAEYFKEKMPG